VNWFRVPSHIILMEPDEAAAWLWLLGMWHAGHAPRHNEIRRHLGWGAGRVQKFIPKVEKWAAEAGAAMPPGVAEQFRSSCGAVAEQLRSNTGAGETKTNAVNSKAPEQQRSDTGAGAEQERSDSRARNSSAQKRERREEEREKKGEEPTQTIHGPQATVVLPEPPPEESPLLALLASSGMPMGQAAAVARKLLEVGIVSLDCPEMEALDEWDLGRIVGTQKGRVIAAFRKAGWLPPKERRQQGIPALPPGLKVLDEKGNPIGVIPPTTKQGKKAAEKDDWFGTLQQLVSTESEANGK
jgi:hypothetical protein